MSGDTGDDPEHEDGDDQGTGDCSPDAPQTVRLATTFATPGDTLGELTDTDHAHGRRPATGLQSTPATDPHRR
jgi:hypothetical protein